jgi:hypothetical protein
VTISSAVQPAGCAPVQASRPSAGESLPFSDDFAGSSRSPAVLTHVGSPGRWRSDELAQRLGTDARQVPNQAHNGRNLRRSSSTRCVSRSPSMARVRPPDPRPPHSSHARDCRSSGAAPRGTPAQERPVSSAPVAEAHECSHGRPRGTVSTWHPRRRRRLHDKMVSTAVAGRDAPIARRGRRGTATEHGRAYEPQAPGIGANPGARCPLETGEIQTICCSHGKEGVAGSSPAEGFITGDRHAAQRRRAEQHGERTDHPRGAQTRRSSPEAPRLHDR